MAVDEIRINDFGGGATLKVSVMMTKRFAFRLWLAIRLIRLASRIAHIKFECKELGVADGKSSNDN